MRRRDFAGRLAAAAALTASCRQTPSGPTRLRLANVQGILAPVLAHSLGSFAEQWIEVEMSEMPGVSKSVQGLVGGSVDVCVGGLDQAIQLNVDGVGVNSFFLIGLRPGAALVVSPRATTRIRRIADLKGSTVGVTAPGSTAQWYLYHLMEREGLAPADVSITGIGTMATAVAALEQGRVDAAIVLPYPLAALRRKYADLRVLAEMITAAGTRRAYGMDTLPNLCLIARLDWLAGNRELARRTARAMASAHAWIQAHSPAEIRDRLPAASRLDDPEAELEYLARIKDIYSPDGKMPESGPADLMRVLARSIDKLRNARIDPRTAYSNDYLAG
jgi:NitT/TauT family transport system substrate-binding protein